VRQCSATKKDGERCKAPALDSEEYCWVHSPEGAQRHRRSSAKGGQSGTKELKHLKARIWEVTEGVLDGSVDRSRAAVAIQGFNSLRGVLELERKVRELDELEERIAALEGESADHPAGGARWGA
jgi:hypothetical protein